MTTKWVSQLPPSDDRVEEIEEFFKNKQPSTYSYRDQIGSYIVTKEGKTITKRCTHPKCNWSGRSKYCPLAGKDDEHCPNGQAYLCRWCDNPKTDELCDACEKDDIVSKKESAKKCNGRGDCINQDYDGNCRVNPYCPNGCQTVKCPNYILCKVIAPQYYLDSHKGYCVNCAMCSMGTYPSGEQLLRSDDSSLNFTTDNGEIVKRKCYWCGKTLQPVGNSRRNGANHDDWDTRGYHKKCYKEYKKEQDGDY